MSRTTPTEGRLDCARNLAWRAGTTVTPHHTGGMVLNGTRERVYKAHALILERTGLDVRVTECEYTNRPLAYWIVLTPGTLCQFPDRPDLTPGLSAPTITSVCTHTGMDRDPIGALYYLVKALSSFEDPSEELRVRVFHKDLNLTDPEIEILAGHVLAHKERP